MTPEEHRARLELVVETMREASRHDDPQTMVKAFADRMREWIAWDGMISLSRRGVVPPAYRIARASVWKEELDPWKDRKRLPVRTGGLLGRIMDRHAPVLIDDLRVDLDDPARELLEPFGSLVAIPVFDQGTAQNVVIWLRNAKAAFPEEDLPEWVWMANLFGRATNNLVLKNDLARAYAALDEELATVARIQTSLLPVAVPTLPGLEVAVHYRTSRKAGGDYYDFFEIQDGRLGVLVADVCGHGTPAAVYMAITQCLARSFRDHHGTPAALLESMNRRLVREYTGDSGNFVAALAGVYDPRARTFSYATAGLPPPRLRRNGGSVVALGGAAGLPLGIDEDAGYAEAAVALRAEELLLLHTDGLTEARVAGGALYGEERLDRLLASAGSPAVDIVATIVADVATHLGGGAPCDDLTALLLRVR